ncbi:DUF3515 domain-containing protein [Streptomyces sp. HUAS TT20]|uniref:DUF3515 domain-containing protein n=1 Tax=Streptomyces sp. HUAS TT20 TaxID=3447509 RepID=UPI0021D9ADEB|nr:DUF3515 domain-containing protein [Streptomyces sp. HUAS 15-9]UXY28871.1 DUF3515 domain-containing protein [Streptomyces sp. HUAS 15-9]
MVNRSVRNRVLLPCAATLAVLGAYMAVTGGESGPEAAPHARDAACRAAAGKLPDKIAGLERGHSGTAGVTVWGDGKIVARCGIPMPPKTPDPCATVNGVDWVWHYRQGGDDHDLLVTYGRSPGLEVTVQRGAPSDAALVELTKAASVLPKHRKCLDSQGN